MRLRTYRAFTHDEAYEAARSDIGPEVQVVQSRRVRRPGLRGFWQRPIVELTVSLPARSASPPDPASVPATARAAAAYAAGAGGTAESADPGAGEPLDMDLERAKTRRLAQALMLKLEREGKVRADTTRNDTAVEDSARLRGSIDSRVHPREEAPTVSAPPDVVARRYVLDQDQPPQRTRERAALLGDEATVGKGVAPPPAEDSTVEAAVDCAVRQQRLGVGEFGALGSDRHPQALHSLYRELIEQEVTGELVDQLLCDVSDELGPRGLEDPRLVRSVAHRHIAGLLPIDDRPLDVGEARRLGRPHVVALIGPTGVGKTTTIAKLAAACRFRDDLKVGLVTTDSFRMAAVDQLKSYAEILSVPLEVVIDVEDMAPALRRLAHCDVILLDTAGRSRRDSERLEDLRAFLRAADPDETHLVLSTTTGERTMMRDADAFASLGADRVVLTKLDEAGGFGIVLNVIQRLGARISFVTTGQEVPDDIEHGGAERIARMLLAGLGPEAAAPPSTPDHGRELV